MHGERPGRGHDPGGVVVPSRARPGDHDQQVALGGAPPDGRGDPLPGSPARSAGSSLRTRPRAPARRASASSCRGSRPGPARFRSARISSPVGRIKTRGLFRTESCFAPAATARPGRRDAAGGLPGAVARRADVLADGADVLVRREQPRAVRPGLRCRSARARASRPRPGRRAWGRRCRPRRRRRGPGHGAGLARAEGVRGADRDAVHSGGVERRRGPGGPYRGGGDQAGRLSDRHGDGGQPFRAARRVPGRLPRLQGACAPARLG